MQFHADHGLYCKSEHCLCQNSASPSSVFTDRATVAHASRLLRLLNSESYTPKLEDSEPDCGLTAAGCVHRTCLDDYPYWIGAPSQNEYYNAYHNQSPVSPDVFAANSCDTPASNSPPYVNSPLEKKYINDGRCTCHIQVDAAGCLYHNVPQSTCLHSSEMCVRGKQSMCITTDRGTTSDKCLSYFDILDFAFQIARGMEHLDKMKVRNSLT